MTDLGTLVGRTTSDAWGINAGRKWWDRKHGGHSHASSTTERCTIWALSGCTDSFAYGINATGDIVGSASNGATPHAFLYNKGRWSISTRW